MRADALVADQRGMVIHTVVIIERVTEIRHCLKNFMQEVVRAYLLLAGKAVALG
jgi:hypothetical protein